MKANILLLVLVATILFGCWRRTPEPIRYTSYKAVFMSRDVFAAKVVVTDPTPIVQAAKIYHKDNYIYISENKKGVHIIDNTNPEKPINKRFIAIEGCLDVAIKNNVLYADNVVDLIAIDLLEAEIGNIKVLKRVQNVFKEPLPPDGLVIPDKYNAQNRTPNTFIIGWEK
jgi:hypothetical protein